MKESLQSEIKELEEKKSLLLAEITEAKKLLKEINLKRLNSEKFMKELSYRESNIIRMYEQAGVKYKA